MWSIEGKLVVQTPDAFSIDFELTHHLTSCCKYCKSGLLKYNKTM